MNISVRRYLFNILMLLIYWVAFTGISFAQSAYFDTVSVYFDIGKSRLLKEAQITLDSVITDLKQTKEKVLIYGYADYLGTDIPNKSLSDHRATIVQQYLLGKGLSPDQIIQTAGVGQIEIRGDEAHGNREFRKTSIFIRRTGTRKISSKTGGQLTRSMQETEVGKTIILDNIYFLVNSSRYTGESQAVVDELLEIMQSNSALKIKLEGHVCCVQRDEDAFDIVFADQFLSRNRARAIFAFLVRNGIAKSRISYQGYGKSRPMVDPEITEEDKEKNRRVEIRILAK